MMKRGVSFLLVFILCFSMISTVSAKELNESVYITHDNNITINVADEKGNDTQYQINEELTEIPIYGVKESEDDIEQQNLVVVATLHIFYQGGKIYFQFKPANLLIGAITLGFTGDITTYQNGMRYGYNNYILPLMSGAVSASARGTGSISGKYSVIGYKTTSVLRGFSW